MGRLTVRADAQNGSIQLRKPGDQIGEIPGFPGSAGGVVFGVKKEHHPLAGII